MTDSHTHLYSTEFKDDIDQVIERAFEKGIDKFYLPAISSLENEDLLSLEKKYPENVFAMTGLHPCSVKEDYKNELELIRNQLKERSFAGIGETGLDFYWDTSFKNEKYESLHQHIEWAIEYKRPLILHTRNAMDETINEIKKYKQSELKGIFHCFGGTLEQAQQIIDLDFMLGIGGVLTYKKTDLPFVLNNIDMKHLVLETDAPYLSPVPYRGKRNEPAYMVHVAQKLAEIKGISLQEVERITSENAGIVFG